MRLPAEEVVELKLVEVDLDGNNPVWQEGPNVQLDVRFGVANPRLQLSMGSFEMYSGPDSIYSEENIQSVRPVPPQYCLHRLRPLFVLCATVDLWPCFDVGVPTKEGGCAGCSERDAAAADRHIRRA